MESGKRNDNSRKVARVSPRATFFAIIGVILGAGVIFLGLKWIVDNPTIAPELKMTILFGFAFNFLILGFAAISLLIRKKQHAEARFSDGQVIVLAYFVPAISLYVMVFAYIAYSQNWLIDSLSSYFLWISRLPVLWLVQVSVLAWIMCASQRKHQQKDQNDAVRLAIRESINEWKQVFISRRLIMAILFGLGSWLAARFLISIESHWLSGQVYFNSPVDGEVFKPVFWITVVIGLTIAPWAEEVFYRERLLSHLESRSGWLTGILISSTLFGILQFRPFLFLPAVLFGFASGWLRSHYGVKTAILAHVLFNLLTFTLNWVQVI